jgi:hypothetical protein
MVLLAAGVFAFWGLRSDTGAAGRDRLARQLFDCAEQGLAAGKQYFSLTYRDVWDVYLKANVCASGTVPCPPVPTGAPGSSADGYQDTAPFMNTVVDAAHNISLIYHVAIYNNPETGAGASKWADTDNRVIVYSRCIDPSTNQSRAVQAVIDVPIVPNNDYTGQAGRGFRNQGNANF